MELKVKWECLVEDLEQEDWWDVCMAPCQITISSRLLLIQIKYLHMVYRTPIQLHKAFPAVAPGCPRCPCDQASFTWCGLTGVSGVVDGLTMAWAMARMEAFLKCTDVMHCFAVIILRFMIAGMMHVLLLVLVYVLFSVLENNNNNFI